MFELESKSKSHRISLRYDWGLTVDFELGDWRSNLTDWNGSTHAPVEFDMRRLHFGLMSNKDSQWGNWFEVEISFDVDWNFDL